MVSINSSEQGAGGGGETLNTHSLNAQYAYASITATANTITTY